MRARRTPQDIAHELLLEWACGLEAALGAGYPSAPMSAPVQGAKAEFTAPERYARRHRRFEQLDRAVRRVGDVDPVLRGVLWQKYAQSKVDEALMADEHGVSLRTWRRWRDQARAMFLEAYEAVEKA